MVYKRHLCIRMTCMLACEQHSSTAFGSIASTCTISHRVCATLYRVRRKKLLPNNMARCVRTAVSICIALLLIFALHRVSDFLFHSYVQCETRGAIDPNKLNGLQTLAQHRFLFFVCFNVVGVVMGCRSLLRGHAFDGGFFVFHPAYGARSVSHVFPLVDDDAVAVVVLSVEVCVSKLHTTIFFSLSCDCSVCNIQVNAQLCFTRRIGLFRGRFDRQLVVFTILNGNFVYLVYGFQKAIRLELSTNCDCGRDRPNRIGDHKRVRGGFCASVDCVGHSNIRASAKVRVGERERARGTLSC